MIQTPKNYFLRRKGYGYTSCSGIAEAMKELDPNVDFGVVRSDQGIPDTDGMVFRWGCAATIPGPVTIVNNAESIHKVYDKKKFRLLCDEEGIAPKSWADTFEYLSFEFCDGIDTYQDVIVRKNFHKQGNHLHRCKTADEVVSACDKYDDYYISAYIPKVAEYRVLVSSGRIIYIYEKKPSDPDDIAWNHSNGGSIVNVRWSDWPINVAKVAVLAYNLSGLDFAAVDVMVDEDGKAYVLEANTAPETTGPYNQKCFAKGMNYILKNGKDKIDTDTSSSNWKNYIHPALTDLAIV